ncbi:SMC domain protein [Candidatus Gastranaerophilus sp. (ex Termes propinquus)]|nr:SMC domain protein [Candidatus Gastranaerophilus sp. (ex Termes propinquus)]
MERKNSKKIPKEQLLLSLDRLTRFKPTADKYARVFNDIVNRYSSENIKTLSPQEVCARATDIFNSSAGFEGTCTHLEEMLKEEERATFFQDEESEKYLKTRLNIAPLAAFLASNDARKEMPLNLKRLVLSFKNPNIPPEVLREKYSLRWPLEKIILCEGATEEILLEELAKCAGYDFCKNGVYLLGAGGKNQVARKYYKMLNEVRLPIFILLDSDAKETEKLIAPKLRACDALYLIKGGEFEDILPESLIVRTLNAHFKNYIQCTNQDFDKTLPQSKNLKEIFRQKGYGDFKKCEFAKILKTHIQKEELDGELFEIIKMIAAL